MSSGPARAVWLAEEFPHSIWYSTARPVGLMASRGVDVHIVTGSSGTGGRRVIEGLHVHWADSLVAKARVVHRLKPDALFLESPCGDLLLTVLCRNTWVRTPIASANPVKLWLQRQLCKQVTSLSITNPHDASSWPIIAGRDDVPYPVDVTFWSEPTPRQPTFWSDRGWTTPTGPVLGYVSNLLPRKAQVELIEWLRPLLVERPNARLALVGNSFDDGYLSQLHATVVRLGLSDQVLVMGGLDPEGVRQFFAWTDIHIVNTTSETQCMAVFESLAAGVATLVRDIPVLTEAFPDLPAHSTGGALRSNVTRLLDQGGARDQILAASKTRLEWADVRRHDRLVIERCAEWGLL